MEEGNSASKLISPISSTDAMFLWCFSDTPQVFLKVIFRQFLEQMEKQEKRHLGCCQASAVWKVESIQFI